MTLFPPPVAPEWPACPPTKSRAPEASQAPAPVREKPAPVVVAGWEAVAAIPRRLSVSRQRRLRQGGRSVLLWAVALYVATQCAMGFITPRWQPSQAINETRKRRRLLELAASEPARPLVLTLGSSRMSWAYRSERTNGQRGPDGRPLLAYNFGVPAAGPIHERQYVEEMLQAGIRPRLLIVEYLPLFLCKPGHNITSEEGMTAAHCMSPAQLLRMAPYFASPNRKVGEWFAARLAPCYAYRADIHEELREFITGLPGETSPPVDEWGWRILHKYPVHADLKALYSACSYGMYGPSLAHFRLGTGPVRALFDLLALCRRERLPVALVVMPESSKFRGLYSPAADTAAANVLAEAQDRFAVPVINARLWLADEDFEDGHHVVLAGAERFTARLNEHVQRLLSQERGPTTED